MKTCGISAGFSALFTFLFLLSHPLLAWEETLCERYVLRAEEEIEFSKNELTLICGSQRVKEWQKISEAQSLYHLKIFLGDRGYYQILTKAEGNLTLVLIPPKTRVSEWNLNGTTKVTPSRFRKILGEPITPKLLDSVSDLITLDLQNQGYACPVVRTEAQVDQKTLNTKVETGQIKKIKQVTRQKIEGMDTEALRRYDAFQLDSLFQKDLVRLTEVRVLSDNSLQDSHFEIDCAQDNDVILRQKNLAGPPRLFLVGIGANTEKGPSLKVSWKHLRLGEQASRLAFSLSGSFREQRLDALLDWYFPNPLNRFHLQPGFSLSHRTENSFERYEGELRLTPATSWDNSLLGVQFSFGPTLNFEKTVVGFGPNDAKFMAFFAGLRIKEHRYELYESSPRQGFELNVNDLTAVKDVFSNMSASKVGIRFTYLWNFANWDPPLWIFGLRGAMSSTLTDETVTSSVLPSSFRHFLGGSGDLRGFSRLSLPGPEGALTATYLSAEIRLSNYLPWSLQPFAFFDIGMLGKKSLQLDGKVYPSPGLGLRWESPIGVFRGTGALGDGKDLNLYISYGEEF